MLGASVMGRGWTVSGAKWRGGGRSWGESWVGAWTGLAVGVGLNSKGKGLWLADSILLIWGGACMGLPRVPA